MTGELADPSFVWWSSTTPLSIPPSPPPPPPALPTQVIAYIPLELLGLEKATAPGHGRTVCDDITASLGIPDARVVEIRAVVSGEYSQVTSYIEVDDNTSTPTVAELLTTLLTLQLNGALILDGATCARLELLSSPVDVSPPPPPKDDESESNESKDESKKMEPLTTALVAVVAVSAIFIIVLSTAVVILLKRLRRTERVSGAGVPDHNEKRLSAV